MATSNSKMIFAMMYRIFYGWDIVVCAVVIMTFSHCSRDFRNPQLCNDTIRTDCSYQISNYSKDICVVIPTKECQTYNFSTLANLPLLLPKHQEASSFSVLLKPYVYNGVSIPVPAVEFEMTSSDSNINGFILLVTEVATSNSHYNSCRIFNFEEARKVYKGQVALLYDCYYSLTRNHYQITVRSIPQNEQLEYIATIPYYEENIEADNLCKWKSVLIIYMGSISQGRVEIKFTPASSKFNVTHYNLSLINKDSNKPNISDSKYVSIENTPNKSMLLATFKDVPNGNYVVSLSPVKESRTINCSTTESYTFRVNSFSGDNTLNSAVIIAATGVAVIVFAIVISLYHIFRPAVIRVRPKILIVYSYDCKEHKNVVSKFASFLKRQCYIDVFIDMHEVGNQNADTWFIRKIDQADAVVIVISEGVFHKCEKENYPPMKEGLPWRNTFSVAKTLLLRAGLRENKNIIKVYFKYSGSHHIPLELQVLGETFQLMHELNKFLCYIHNKSRKNFLHIYPRMPGSDFLATSDGMKLNDAIEDMVHFQENNSDWFMQALESDS